MNEGNRTVFPAGVMASLRQIRVEINTASQLIKYLHYSIFSEA
jgi:hypothetical protein